MHETLRAATRLYAMSIATLIAAIGAAAAVLSVAFLFVSHRQSRPIIIVESESIISSSEEGTVVVVDVRNEGRQGVTLTDVGLVASMISKRSSRFLRYVAPGRVARRDDEIRRRGVSYGLAVELNDNGREIDNSIFLEPLKRTRVTIPMADAVSRQGQGMTTWPYATDVTGRTYYAERPADLQDVA